MADLPLNDDKLSQLADGELTADELGDVLLPALNDETLRHRLQEHLLLRQKLRGWRQQMPKSNTVFGIDRASQSFTRSEPQRSGPGQWSQLGQLAAAAAVGGVLVVGAMLALRVSNNPVQPAGRIVSTDSALIEDQRPTSQARVSSEEQQQVAEVFAFYESVAGPLQSYVDTAGSITVETLPGGVSEKQPLPGEPIAIVLRFSDPSGTASRPLESLVVVRENAPLKVSLQNPGGRQRPDLYVVPSRTNGAIDVRYVISMSADKAHQSASIAGWKTIGLQETSLGGLALGDRSVQITASAWAIK